MAPLSRCNAPPAEKFVKLGFLLSNIFIQVLHAEIYLRIRFSQFMKCYCC